MAKQIDAGDARKALEQAQSGSLPDPEQWPAIIDALSGDDDSGLGASAGEELNQVLHNVLNQAVESAPDSPGPYIARGAIFRARGWLAAAADELTYAGELANSDDPEPWLRLAELEQERGLWDEAAHALDQALENGADGRDLFARLGEAHMKAADFPSAIAAFEEGLEDLPTEPRLLLGRALASLELELFKDAIEDCQAAEGHERPAEVSLVHARALIGAGQEERALEVLNSALGTSPDDVECLRLRGDLRSHSGDLAEAVDDYRSAEAIEPDDETALAIAECSIELGDASGGLSIAQELVERLQKDPQSQDEPQAVEVQDARLVMARALRSLDRENEAIESIHLAIDIDHEDAEAYLERAEIHAAAGRTNLAWRDARWAIERDSELIDAYVMRGRLALEIESEAEAIGDLDAALELDPKNGPAKAWRGLAYARAGNRPAAEDDWDAAEEDLAADHPLRETIAKWRSE